MKHNCVSCGKTLGLFNLSGAMKQDMENYKKELEKQCPGCSILKNYGSREDLADHLLEHHSRKLSKLEELRNGLRRLIY